jgi:hypothetical protein
MLLGQQPCRINVLDVGAIEIEGGTPAPYYYLVKAGYARAVGFEPDAKCCEAPNRKYGRSTLVATVISRHAI